MTTRQQSSNCKAAATTLGKKGSSDKEKSAAGKKLAHCRWKTSARPKPAKKARRAATVEVKTARALKKKNDAVGLRARAAPTTPRKKGKKKMTPAERYAAQAGLTLTPAPKTRPKALVKRARTNYGK